MRREKRAFITLCACIAVSALAMSCDVSAPFLSDSEKSSLYNVSVASISGEPIQNGDALSPGQVLVPSVSALPGAADPSSFEISLEGLRETRIAALRINAQTQNALAADTMPGEGTPVAGGTNQTSLSVERIAGKLPGLAIPQSIPPGTYKIQMNVFDRTGARNRTSTVVFIGFDEPYVESATSFPPSVEPGAPVLLALSLGYLNDITVDTASNSNTRRAPWIEWSINGSVFAAGLLASGCDRTVWTVPKTAGAYPVTVQVYPGPPLDGRSFGFPAPAHARRDVPVVATQSPAGSGDDFADPLSFVSLLRLDGDFSDIGTRPRTAQPEPFGLPRLELYSGGFGYRFNASSGVRIPGLMPPSRDDRLAPFSILVRLSPEDEDGTGTIARFRSKDGSYSLALGLDAWKPYAEFSFEGKTQRSTALSAIPHTACTLEAVFKPSGTILGIAWTAEGERIAAPSMPLPPQAPAGGAELGGPGSLVGIYDGFGLSSGSQSPAFKLAARRKWKSSLILAESFEDGRIPSSITVSGAVTATQGLLDLGPGSEISFASSFDPAEACVIEASMTGDRASAHLVLSGGDGKTIFSIRGTGEVEDASGKLLGSISGKARLSFTLSDSDSGVSLRAGDKTVSLSLPTIPNNVSLSLKRTEGTGSLSLDTILVRRLNQAAGKE
jgi:hypothetical protein